MGLGAAKEPSTKPNFLHAKLSCTTWAPCTILKVTKGLMMLFHPSPPTAHMDTIQCIACTEVLVAVYRTNVSVSKPGAQFNGSFLQKVLVEGRGVQHELH